jgi:hypothetical protein
MLVVETDTRAAVEGYMPYLEMGVKCMKGETAGCRDCIEG